ncbi:hypothetical protein TrLO_g3573 [Triparma laevis f. longispina]|uniref:Cryptochrome/DNA photolyase FAD-binding domain-containing protein n=1 Tax=Triparma laevis f. longispina TaxID=1714387 RepID=A0A9W7DPD1_9STRA|nr:hypothetical protein TrLO_g3573 [Triparma laevis f. longispina]
MIDEGVTEPIPKPTSLPKVVSVPPQLCTFVEASSTNWSKELIELWGPITESEAKRRCELFLMSTHNVTTNIGNGKGLPPSTKLSPYLRFGLISPRTAFYSGARLRDLLWRDWSYYCWSKCGALREGECVVELMDGVVACYDEEEELRFKSWCVGNTGSGVVDSAMKQLWRTGYLPRHLRLLVANCLVEGLGVDWRFGRDWFERTLVDFDARINECMWQNAGLVGLDPFYVNMQWEVEGEEMGEELEELKWPKGLREVAKRKPEPRWIEEAQLRRDDFKKRGVYRAAKKIVNAGVRVNWENGGVIGVGNILIEEYKPYIDIIN